MCTSIPGNSNSYSILFQVSTGSSSSPSSTRAKALSLSPSTSRSTSRRQRQPTKSSWRAPLKMNALRILKLFTPFVKIGLMRFDSKASRLIQFSTWEQNLFFFFFFFFFKNGPFPASFLYFRLFYKQLTVNKCSIKVADDWIRTWVLWNRNDRSANCATTTSLFFPRKIYSYTDQTSDLKIVKCWSNRGL